MEIFPDNGYSVRKPIVAAVRGGAVGVGFSLAVRCCDITVMGEDTRLVYPEPRIGVLGGLIEHTAVMPFKIALEFTMTGEPIPAERAYELGRVCNSHKRHHFVARYGPDLRPLLSRQMSRSHSHQPCLKILFSRGNLAIHPEKKPISTSEQHHHSEPTW